MFELFFYLIVVAVIYLAIWQLVVWTEMFNADDDK